MSDNTCKSDDKISADTDSSNQPTAANHDTNIDEKQSNNNKNDSTVNNDNNSSNSNNSSNNNFASAANNITLKRHLDSASLESNQKRQTLPQIQWQPQQYGQLYRLQQIQQQQRQYLQISESKPSTVNGIPVYYAGDVVICVVRSLKFGKQETNNEMEVIVGDEGLLKKVYVDGSYGIEWDKYPKKVTRLFRENAHFNIKKIDRKVCFGFKSDGNKCTDLRCPESTKYCKSCNSRLHEIQS